MGSGDDFPCPAGAFRIKELEKYPMGSGDYEIHVLPQGIYYMLEKYPMGSGDGRKIGLP